MTSYLSHLECSLTGESYPAREVPGLSRAGRPLLVRYDLAALKDAVSKETLAKREDGFWRYAEFLPVAMEKNRISLGEVVTPLIRTPRIEALRGGGELYVKDEGRLPTGSSEARGLALAVSMAKELRLKHLAMATDGDAGAALAAYASRVGLRVTIFCPDETPPTTVREIARQGADVYRVNGLINDCGRIVEEGKEKAGWFDVSTLKEPYRIEGKKTMGLELAEQFGWELPDWIFYPTGGGAGLIGMWKAFDELEAIGWIGPKRPKLAAVQATGCAPIVGAWARGEEHAPLWENASTYAAGIRVPVTVGDFLIIRAVRESEGYAVAVDDDDIRNALDEMAREEGLLLCPEGAATYAAYRRAVLERRIKRSDRVVLFNCATGLKFPMPKVGKFIDRTQPVDYAHFGKVAAADD